MTMSFPRWNVSIAGDQSPETVLPQLPIHRSISSSPCRMIANGPCSCLRRLSVAIGFSLRKLPNPKSQTPNPTDRFCGLGFGIWDLGFGIWDLGFAILLPDSDRRIHPQTDDRTGRQVDVLAFRRGDRAARADYGAEDRTLHAADDPAEDGAR